MRDSISKEHSGDRQAGHLKFSFRLWECVHRHEHLHTQMLSGTHTAHTLMPYIPIQSIWARSISWVKTFMVKPWSMCMVLQSGHQEWAPSKGNRKNKASQTKKRYTSSQGGETSSGWHWVPCPNQRSGGKQFVSCKMQQHWGAYWSILHSRESVKVLGPTMVIQAVIFKACVVWWDPLPHWEYFYRGNQK